MMLSKPGEVLEEMTKELQELWAARDPKALEEAQKLREQGAEVIVRGDTVDVYVGGIGRCYVTRASLPSLFNALPANTEPC